jgi:hypothetical protein
MTGARLKTLVIENFRSLQGKIVVPLDAQVVLVYGSNGMGKTSVFSALELALTGKIAHLASDGDGYQSHLTTLGTDGGAIELTTTVAYKPGANVGGSLDFSDIKFEPTALLDSADARFFSERCYMPQATLGRLLEIYDDQRTSTTSPLTLFVRNCSGSIRSMPWSTAFTPPSTSRGSAILYRAIVSSRHCGRRCKARPSLTRSRLPESRRVRKDGLLRSTRRWPSFLPQLR